MRHSIFLAELGEGGRGKKRKKNTVREERGWGDSDAERSQKPPAASFSSLVATYRTSPSWQEKEGKCKGGLGSTERGKPYLRY